MGVIVCGIVKNFSNWWPYPIFGFLSLNVSLNYSVVVKEGTREDMRLISVRSQKAHIVLAPFY